MTLIRQVHRFSEQPAARQFLKFSIVGAMNTGIDFTVYALLLHFTSLHYLAANIFAFMAGATNSYLWNRWWTFTHDDQRWHHQATKFFIVLVSGFMINETLLYVFVTDAHIQKIVAKIPVIIIVLGWNFGLSRGWAFKGHKPDLSG